MFDRISGRYDLLNRLLSLGIDRAWRRKGLKMLIPFRPQHILDIATGTGDLAFMAADILKPGRITGVDLSLGMLTIARQRLSKLRGSNTIITFEKGDAEKILHESNTFDAVTVAFGVRNFADLSSGLQEMQRVLKPGAPVMVLEFTKPRVFPMKQSFNIYFRHILPFIGWITSGDWRAYRYLYESVQAFPDYEKFNQELIKAGFEKPSYTTLSAGICAIYLAFKP